MLKIYYIVLIPLFLISSIQAKQIFGNIIIDEVTSIYDGDTFRVNINSYPDIIGKKMAIRINGIDTPDQK